MSAPTRARLPAGERRQQILAAARRLFGQSGYGATTSRQIAEAAHISDALIYRHFADKEALLLTLVDQLIERLQQLPRLDGPFGSPDELLRAIGGGFLKLMQQELDLILLLLSERHLMAEDRRFATFIDRAAGGLGRLLDQLGSAAPGQGEGYLLARGFMGSLVAFVLLQEALGLDAVQQVDPQAYLETQVQMVVARLSVLRQRP